MIIEKCTKEALTDILRIINDSASAYRDIIPGDCYRDPYMSLDDLKKQLDEKVEFWCYKHNDQLAGVMGIQDRNQVMLIRHAYVRTTERGKGVGSKLLRHLLSKADKPVLIGTWADAGWAIAFYEKHGFHLLSEEEKDFLLDKYWIISNRQKQASVVLANEDWSEAK